MLQIKRRSTFTPHKSDFLKHTLTLAISSLLANGYALADYDSAPDGWPPHSILSISEDACSAENPSGGRISVSAPHGVGILANDGTCTNYGCIEVSHSAAAGMKSTSANGVLKNNAQAKIIVTSSSTSGVGIDNKGGTLRNAGTISSENGTAIMLSGDLQGTLDSPKVLFEPGSQITGRTAISVTGSEQHDIFITGGRISGDITAGSGMQDYLHIAPEHPRSRSSDPVTAGITGNIKGFEKVLFPRDVRWQIQGIITDADIESPESGSIGEITVGSGDLPVPSEPNQIALKSTNHTPTLRGSTLNLNIHTGARLAGANDSPRNALNALNALTVTVHSDADAAVPWTIAPLAGTNTLTVNAPVSDVVVGSSVSTPSSVHRNSLAFQSAQSGTQNLTISGSGTGNIENLMVQDGAKLGNVDRVGTVSISGSSREIGVISNAQTFAPSVTIAKATIGSGLSSGSGTDIALKTDTQAVTIAPTGSDGRITDLSIQAGANVSAIKGVDNINVTSTDNVSIGLITDAQNLTTSVRIPKLAVSSISRSPRDTDLVLKTDKTPLSIATSGDGGIDAIDILPGARFTSIRGIDTINIEGDRWNVKSVKNPKNININGTIDFLSSGTDAADHETMKVSFDEDGNQPETLAVAVNSGAEINGIAMRDANRPPMHLVYRGSPADQLTGNTASGNGTGDRLELYTSGSKRISGFSQIQLHNNYETSAFASPSMASTALSIGSAARFTLGSNIDEQRLVLKDFTLSGTLALTLQSDTATDAAFIQTDTATLNEGSSSILLSYSDDFASNFDAAKEYLLIDASQTLNVTGHVTVRNADKSSPYLYKAIQTGSGRNHLRLSYLSKKDEIQRLLDEEKDNPSSERTLFTALDDSSPELRDWVVDEFTDNDDNAKALAELARQMTPDNTGMVIQAAQLSTLQAGDAITARQSGIRTGILTGDIYDSGAAWIQYAHNDATQKESGGVAGFETSNDGFTLGTDTEIPYGDSRLGVAYTFSKARASGKGQSRNKATTDTHAFSLYGFYDLDQVSLNSRLSYAAGKNDVRRYTADLSNKAAYDTKTWDLGVLAGYSIPLDTHCLTLQPRAAFHYANIMPDSYREKPGTGASAPLLSFDKVTNKDFKILELGVGAQIVSEVQVKGLTIKPEASLMYYHNFKDDPVSMTAHYAQGGNSFTVLGASRPKGRYDLGLAASAECQDNLTLSASYHYGAMNKFSVHSFIAKARYSF